MHPLKAGALEALALFFQGFSVLSGPWQAISRARRLAALRRRLSHPVPASTQFDGRLRVVGTGDIRLGDACRFGDGVLLETMHAGTIELGRHVRLNQGCVVVAYTRVSIGDDTLIGEYVSIRDANHGTRPGQPIRLQEHDSAPVAIGRDVWIGRGACILPGVAIGDGAVIGANSIVTRNVPPGAVAVGAPAKVIRYREGYAGAVPENVLAPGG